MNRFFYTREPGSEGTILTTEGEAPGTDLATVLDRKRPPLKVCLELSSAIADILTISEEDNAVHGDIKPASIMVDASGAISVDGWGVVRRTTRAPEERPRGPSADIFGLGVVMHSMMSEEPLGTLPSDPDEHDNAVVERVLDMDFSKAEGQRWVDDVRRFLCTIMAYDEAERPNPLDAANVLAFVAEQCAGVGLGDWASQVVEGTPDLSSSQPEELEGPTREAFSVDTNTRQAPSSRGATTEMWSRERLLALVGEDEGELPGPDRVEFSAEPDAETVEQTWENEPRPAVDPPLSPWDPPPVPQRERPEETPISAQHAPQEPASIAPTEAPDAPGHPEASEAEAPAPPAPPEAQETLDSDPQATPQTEPPPADPAVQPVAWTPDSPPATSPEEPAAKKSGCAGVLKALGCAAVLGVLGCMGLVAVGGAAMLYMTMPADIEQGQSEETPERQIAPVELEAAEGPDTPEEPVDEMDFAGLLDSDTPEEEDELEDKPPAKPLSTPKTTTTTTPTTTTTTTPTTPKPKTTTPKPKTPPKETPPKETPPKETAPEETPEETATIPDGSYEVKVSIVSEEKAELRCGDGQQVRFINSSRMSFKGTVSCVILADGARGVVTFSTGGSVNCEKSYTGSTITCSGP